MMVFNDIIPALVAIFKDEIGTISQLDKILVNRDLNGRVRLIIDEKFEEALQNELGGLEEKIKAALECHASSSNLILYHDDIDKILAEEADKYHISDDIELENIFVVDRVVTESSWSEVVSAKTADERTDGKPPKPPRVVFFSIKGGVGRSTAACAVAVALAKEGKKVLILDMDLESPGISYSLVPKNRRCKYGITDWMIENLVGNDDVVLEYIVSALNIPEAADIYVVPASGEDDGEYVTKLGRIYQNSWPRRLNNLVEHLENKYLPDVILIDSRAGIDEIASACLTSLNASLIFLFAIGGDQTWTSYRLLMEHWRRRELTVNLREQLQVVGALIPDIKDKDYFDELLEQSWNMFTEEIYDSVSPGDTGDRFNFDKKVKEAHHYPLPIYWDRLFFAPENMHELFHSIEEGRFDKSFGEVINKIKELFIGGEQDE